MPSDVYVHKKLFTDDELREHARKRMQELRAANPEKYLERDRARDKTEKRKAQKRRNGIEYRMKFPDINWANKIKRKFGLTSEEYYSLLKKQNFGCAICERTEPNGVSNKKFAVDHCHSTGEVRGLLCHSCNTSLGHFNDDIRLLDKAINYLSNDNVVVDWGDIKQTVKGEYNHAV